MRIERVAGRVSAERAADGVVWDAYHEARALGRTRRVRRRSSPARHSRKSWPRRAGAAAAHTRGGSVPRPAHPTQSGDPRERASRRLSCTRLVAGSTDSVWRGVLSPPPFPPPNFPCPPILPSAALPRGRARRGAKQPASHTQAAAVRVLPAAENQAPSRPRRPRRRAPSLDTHTPSLRRACRALLVRPRGRRQGGFRGQGRGRGGGGCHRAGACVALKTCLAHHRHIARLPLSPRRRLLRARPTPAPGADALAGAKGEGAAAHGAVARESAAPVSLRLHR